MNAKANDASIFQYLGEIDPGPLLTKPEEQNLIKNLEGYQKQIIDGFLTNSFSKSELISYLKSLHLTEDGIVDISKRLDDESSKDLIAEISLKFSSLLVELEKPSSSKIQELMNEVSISGTIIHGVVTEIKKKHTKITDVEYKLTQIKKWFEGRTLDNVIDIISKIRNNPEVRTKLRNELGLTELKMLNKCGEWEQIIIEFTDLKGTFPENITFQDVKEAYKKISNLEHYMKKSKDELITRNLRLVVSRAKKFLNRGLEFEDLIQEGNIGLIKAIDKYDSSKKTKVATYATWWIDQSIRRAISNKGKTVRIPTHIEFLQTNLSHLVQKMTGELKRPPTMKEISEKSGIDMKTLEELETRALHSVGIDDELSSGVSLIDLLPSDPANNPLTLTESGILREKIRDILSTLPPRTEKIIRLRFGIGEINDEGETLQDIANKIGITKQGVRVVECSALKKLRKKASKYFDEP